MGDATVKTRLRVVKADGTHDTFERYGFTVVRTRGWFGRPGDVVIYGRNSDDKSRNYVVAIYSKDEVRSVVRLGG
jgi:hypothetical protein